MYKFWQVIKLSIVLLALLMALFNRVEAIEDQADQKKFIILSIDGGGVRGIIPAMILTEIERRLGHQIHEMVDVIAGNSTGGIIALSLATPSDRRGEAQYQAQDLVDLYKNKSDKIFKNSLFRRVITGFNLLGPKYSRKNLDNILAEQFSNKTLRDVLVPVFALSYNLERGEGHIWNSDKSKTHPQYNFYLKDIAAATSAAPTYFAPVSISNVEGNYCYKYNGKIYPNCTEIDGGTFANNPSIIVTASVLKLNPQLNRSDIILISLGTGKVDMIDSVNINNSGILGWVKDANIIDLILNATEDVSEWSVEAFGIKTYRLQVELGPEEGKMDASSSQEIQTLINRTNDYIRDNNRLIAEICKVLLTNFQHLNKVKK